MIGADQLTMTSFLADDDVDCDATAGLLDGNPESSSSSDEAAEEAAEEAAGAAAEAVALYANEGVWYANERGRGCWPDWASMAER